ncbi:MAG: nucleotidyltransferase family protein [Patescibacteria group bacterium]
MNKILKKNFDLLSESLDTVKKHYPIKKMGIFGSVSKGTATHRSDIDILVEFSKPIGIFKFVELEMDLGKILKRRVDLVSKGALKPILKDSILKEVFYV